MAIRTALSRSLNHVLARAGYGFVKLRSHGFVPDETRVHDDRTFAYQNVMIADTYAPWCSDAQFLSVYNNALSVSVV